MSTHSLQFAAARFMLGSVSSEDLVRIADELLTQGVYSYSLGELATIRNPIMSEASPLFTASLKELRVQTTSKEEAASTIAKYYITGIVEGRYKPEEGLAHFMSECYEPLQWKSAEKDIAESCGCRELIDCHYEYEYFAGVYVNHEESERGLAELNQKVFQFATDWIRQRGACHIDRAWLAWNNGCVAKLARCIDAEQRFQDLPILADALEDAGCVNEDILTHCRQPGEHVRGCWVVDLLLGKS
jgi:hypothetical protein